MFATWSGRLVGICILSIFGATPVRVQDSPTASASARKIISKYIAARGGQEAILRHRSRRTLGAFYAQEQGLRGQFEELAAPPNRLLVRMQIDGYGQVIRCFDGESAWQLEASGDAPRQLEGSELSGLREEAEFEPIYKDKDVQSIVDEGTADFAGRLCHRLKIVGRTGKEWSEHFDAASGLLVGRIEGDGDSAVTTTYEEYKIFDGLKFPTHIVKSVRGDVREELHITDITFDSIAPAAFDVMSYAEPPKLPPGFLPRKNGSSPLDEIDRYVLEQMTLRCIPALSLGVVQDGQLIKAEGYGAANLESAAVATEATVYQLASITKVFTATAIMILADEGKIDLDAEVSTYLPEAPDAWRQVTIRHLLRHTSGLVQSLEWGASTRQLTDAEFVDAAAKTRLRFAPGSAWSYSNIGYHLLGLVVQRVTGQSWHAFIREHIFEPAGMSSTRLQTLDALVPNRAAGYRIGDDRQLINGFYDPQTSSAGGLLSTVGDLARFDRALHEEKLLSRNRLREMWDAVPLPDGTNPAYGVGWFVVDLPRGRKLTYHGGDSPSGFSGEMLRYIDDKLTVIVLTNRVGSKPMDVAAGIADTYLRRRR